MIVTFANAQSLSSKLIKDAPSELFVVKKANTNYNLQELTQESRGTLLHFHTVFPFDLFPDEINIDENKVNIISKQFFFTYNVHSVLISDITDVSVDTSLLLATLNIIDSSNFRFPIIIKIPHLTKKHAFAARKLIQGLIAMKRKDIALGDIPLNEVKAEIAVVGETKSEDISGI